MKPTKDQLLGLAPNVITKWNDWHEWDEPHTGHKFAKFSIRFTVVADALIEGAKAALNAERAFVTVVRDNGTSELCPFTYFFWTYAACAQDQDIPLLRAGLHAGRLPLRYKPEGTPPPMVTRDDLLNAPNIHKDLFEPMIFAANHEYERYLAMEQEHGPNWWADAQLSEEYNRSQVLNPVRYAD